MSEKQLPSPELLRQLFHYDPHSGIITWKVSTSNRVKVGQEAGCITVQGYRSINVKNRRIPAHRIAYAIFYNEWPDDEVDHINGARHDNSIKNLRCVSSTENRQNTKIYSNNKSGQIGIFWNKKNKNWRARITVNKKVIEIGSFKKIEDAVKARKDAEAKYGFHPNHGRF